MISLGNPDIKSSSNIPQLQETAALTRAIENVFRKLIRMLIGRMSLRKPQEMIQVIFVEEVEEQLRHETPGKNATLTSLALIAGYDTRKIMRIKSNDSYLKPFHK